MCPHQGDNSLFSPVRMPGVSDIEEKNPSADLRATITAQTIDLQSNMRRVLRS